MATFNVLETETGPVLKLSAADVATLQLREGSTLAVDFQGDDLVLKPIRRRKYTVGELLAESDYSRPRSKEEQEWLDAPLVGRELI